MHSSNKEAWHLKIFLLNLLNIVVLFVHVYSWNSKHVYLFHSRCLKIFENVTPIENQALFFICLLLINPYSEY